VPSTPQQSVRVGRVERLIGLVTPALDLLLTVGDRVSRTVGPDDEYYPIRSAREALELPASGAVAPAEPLPEPVSEPVPDA
jgi:hypothetical protein